MIQCYCLPITWSWTHDFSLCASIPRMSKQNYNELSVGTCHLRATVFAGRAAWYLAQRKLGNGSGWQWSQGRLAADSKELGYKCQCNLIHGEESQSHRVAWHQADQDSRQSTGCFRTLISSSVEWIERLDFTSWNLQKDALIHQIFIKQFFCTRNCSVLLGYICDQNRQRR